MATATVAFLFTDIEGSTPLWEKRADLMRVGLERHDALMRSAIECAQGRVFKTVGDAFCGVFPDVSLALRAALAGQRALGAEDWGALGPLRVRMAIHTGTAEIRDADFLGPPVNRVARILGCGHGGQVLVSTAAARWLQDHAPTSTSLLDLGEHVLRGIEEPERIFQVADEQLPLNFPPLRTTRARVESHLPEYGTPLLGRETLVSEVVAILDQPGRQLLTLIGPGGSGKTRLAVEAAWRLKDHFEAGAHFVRLSEIRKADQVPAAIATVLGVRPANDQTPLQAVASYLREHRALVVLDNLEHVADAAPIIAKMLALSAASFLATSRSPLRLYEEREVAVQALGLPDSHAGQTPDSVTSTASGALFLDRAMAVLPTFRVTVDNADMIAAICRKLDGLPLAIELAAPRLKVLTVSALLARLDQRLALLTGGSRDLDPRQQTLRATIDWSYELLDDAERRLFRRLALFRGGFTVESAEGTDLADTSTMRDTLDLVGSLVDKSLLQRHLTGAAQGRLNMLATVREYAIERLIEAGELEDASDGHARHFAELAMSQAPELHTGQQGQAMSLLATEMENIRAALDWMTERGQHEALAAVTAALGPFWHLHGDFIEGRARVAQAGAVLSESTQTALLADVLLVAGTLAWWNGDGPAGVRDLRRAISLFHALADKLGEGRAHANLSMALLFAGGLPAECEALALAAVELLRESSDLQAQADALHLLGHMHFECGKRDDASAVWVQGLDHSRHLGDRWMGALFTKDLGLVAFRRGEIAIARNHYEASLGILRETAGQGHVADSLNRLGELALHEGQSMEALKYFDEALQISRESGSATGYIETLARIAEVAAVTGDARRAIGLYQECLENARTLEHTLLQAWMLNNLGNLALCEGATTGALELFTQALRHSLTVGREASIAYALEGIATAWETTARLQDAARLVALADQYRSQAGESIDRLEHDFGSAGVGHRLRARMGNAEFEAVTRGPLPTVEETLDALESS